MRRLIMAAGLVLGAWAAHAAGIVGVSPQGEVALVRQITVKFSEAVVPFGDLRLPDPLAVMCQGAAPAGTGRWANDRMWLYDFREALPPGVRCTLKARADWKPLGGMLTGATEFAFSTGGPAIVSAQPYDGSQIEEDQHFLLRLNGAAVTASVAENAWCEVEGIGERLALRVVDGQVREQLLKARHIDKNQADRTLVATCARPLPNAAALRLVWGKGIATLANPSVVTSVEQRYRYQVRPAFTAEFSCERERANSPCLPIRPLRLRFSAPVPRDLAAKVQLRPASGAALAPVFDKDDKAQEVNEVVFPTPLAENAAFTLELPQELKDNASRALANAASFPLRLATGDAPPIAKFSAAPFGVIERFADPKVAPMLPVTLRHVQGDLASGAASGQLRVLRLQSDADILAWYAKLAKYHESRLPARELGLPEKDWTTLVDVTDSRGRNVKRRAERFVATREVSLLNRDPLASRLELPQLAGRDPRPFEVVGIPLSEPGYHVVEIESARLGESLLDRKAPMYVRTGVLVTNLGVHFKLGRENSAVWVTTLDKARPLEGAEVAVNDCNGRRLWSGRTDAQGLARIPQAFDERSQRCLADDGLFVTARHAAKGADGQGVTDTAFVFSGWHKGIEPWRFNVPTAHGPDPEWRAHTVFDRTLLRAGETVSMKHFVRVESSSGLTLARSEDLPTRLKIVHEGSGQEFVQALRWNGARNAVSSWNIPTAAKLGVYNVVLEREGAARGARVAWSSGSFRVEEFRTPLVDARISGPKTVAAAPKELVIDVQLNYFSGGGMVRAPARASALLKGRIAAFRGYDEYSFEPPREPGPGPGPADASAPDEESAARDTTMVADKLPLTTDANGAARLTLKDLPKIARASELLAEVTFNDPNGEMQTAATSIELWPAAVVVGIKAGAWASNRGRVKFTALALDTAGKPLKGQSVEVRGRLAQVISTRKRIVGGFYAYDNRTEVKDLGTLCSGSTDERGFLLCEAGLDHAGQVDLIAQAKDAQGNLVQAATSVWVTKQGELWFAQDNDDRIDVLPEKKRYEPGETAKLQVRMPFREATALVTVEREGILDTRVVTLRGDDPTLELKIEKTWGPNVYVSVLALRGRIREVQWYSFFTWGWKEPLSWARSFWYEGREYQAPTALVDLSRPAFKLGVAAIRVGIKEHELQVSVNTAQPQYAVRQKVQARIKVTQDGKPLTGAEVAFAAVDEGLLALRSNDSWDLLNAMLRQRSWSVETSTAQSEIIGRRHYGRKAVAAGGGGGSRGGTRELFDTLLLWRAVVPLDANGEAQVEIPLNDSLTSFKLVAVADAGVHKFGSGTTSIRVTQDLQLLSGLPPLVREGDRFDAGFTLRNTTPRAMTVKATLVGPGVALAPQTVALAAGAAAEVKWPVEVPAGSGKLEWTASAEETNGAARDRVKIVQAVQPAVPVRVWQALLQPLADSVSIPLAPPAGALAGVGGVRASLQPKLSGALPGLKRFFESYPYSCLEQKASKAIALHDATAWTALAGEVAGYLDRDGLANYFPPRTEDAPHGSDRLTAYLLSSAHEAGLAWPEGARNAMLQGLAAFVDGRLERRFSAPRPDLQVRKLAALEALARFGRVQARQFGVIEWTPNAWPTASLLDAWSLLKRVDEAPERAARLEEVQRLLRARLVQGGTTLRFTTEDSDGWWWLMDSADGNAARLVLAAAEAPDWKDEVPLLVNGALARQRGGAWATTTANLWGVLALERFGQRFEAQPVSGKSALAVGDTRRSVDWKATPEGASEALPWGPVLVARHEGSGRPWLSLQTLAAVPLKETLAAGYRITKTTTVVERKAAGVLSRGDIVRVRLDVEAVGDMAWVVVSDPVPAGAALLGGGGGRDSSIATRGEKREGRGSLAFEERAPDAWRGYFEWLPRGRQVVEYTMRLNATGRFALPPTRVEAMYAPETFGERPNDAVEVRP